jgi:hypothetical protein
MVTPSFDRADEFAAVRRTQNARHWAMPMLPSDRPVALVIGDENAPTPVGAVTSLAIGPNAWAPAWPMGEAAMLSMAMAIDAPPATSALRYTTTFW